MACESCGEDKPVMGTSYVGTYCVDCHEIVIAESKEAIAAIRKQSKGRKAVRG